MLIRFTTQRENGRFPHAPATGYLAHEAGWVALSPRLAQDDGDELRWAHKAGER